MATQEQIEQITALLQENHPARFFNHMGQSQAGIGAVMRFLSQSRKATAGEIAEFMNVSTARVAVLLKKMEAKGLIVKERDPSDARITIVRLSELGMQTDARIQDQMHRKVGEVIDKVGMARMLDFVTIAREIRDTLPDPDAKLQDPLDDA